MRSHLLNLRQRIASEQRETERRKREFQDIEKAVALTKRKFKQETTEVMLGVSSRCRILLNQDSAFIKLTFDAFSLFS